MRDRTTLCQCGTCSKDCKRRMYVRVSMQRARALAFLDNPSIEFKVKPVRVSKMDQKALENWPAEWGSR